MSNAFIFKPDGEGVFTIKLATPHGAITVGDQIRLEQTGDLERDYHTLVQKLASMATRVIKMPQEPGVEAWEIWMDHPTSDTYYGALIADTWRQRWIALKHSSDEITAHANVGVAIQELLYQKD